MVDQTEQVQTFFNRPQFYLDKNVGLVIRAQVVRELVNDVPHSKILDIGCGDGSLSLQFQDLAHQITLVDFAVNMLNLAKSKVPKHLVDRITFIQSDFFNYSPEDDFEVVFCIGVLAHVSSLHAAIKKISSYMNGGNYCILQFTDQGQLISRLTLLYYKFLHLLNIKSLYPLTLIRHEEIKEIVEQHDLDIIQKKCYWTTPPGVSRLPSSISIKILTWMNKHRSIAQHGGEKMVLLIKHESAAHR